MQFSLTINGESTRCALPIKWNTLLDERLDEGRLSIRNVNTKLYPIGASASIRVNNTQKDFIISADESTEAPAGSGFYNHELSLIEPTKLLEGTVVESLTFTNTRAREYHIAQIESAQQYRGISSGWVDVDYKECCEEINNPMEDVYYTSDVELPALNTVIVKRKAGQPQANNTYEYDTTSYNSSIFITKPNGEVDTITLPTIDSPTAYVFDMLGTYSLSYRTKVNRYYDVGEPDQFLVQATINATYLGKEAEPTNKWTITSVINRVLNLAEPHLQSVSPRYQLDPAQAAEFEKIPAPEFAFTKCTLKEILDQIGGFIHGVPRLIRGESGKLDTIHYDMLDGTEEALISSDNVRYISEIHSQNIEDYVTELDSTVDNLVNTLDSGEGAVTEPYTGGFKSVRSEEAYARIEEGNMVISTTLPIYSVQKLEVIAPNNKVGDITAYVYEGAEYGRLSSFDGYYSMSKAYAIYYNLGEKDIKGLAYKSPTVIGGAGAEYSITNIIKAATDADISSGWWEDKNNKTGNYPKLAFRITYTPIFSARILQHKPCIEKGALQLAMVYNQGANLVETRYYGENMKGVIARMGNPEFTRSYRMPDLTYVPEIGQIFKRDGDEYFISSVTVAVYPESVDFTVGMSKDFDRLSQYIGINSEWRAYEVSERKAYNRDIVYRDFCVIGDDPSGDNIALARGSGLFYIANAFSQTLYNQYERFSEPLTVAKVTTYDDLNNPYTVTLPVVSTAFGNAMVFSFGMADNYSAGAQSVYDSNGDVSGYWQTDVPYVDYYGRVKTMAFMLGSKGETPSFNGSTTFELPAGDHYGQYTGAISTTDNNPLVIDKNGSEILRVNYQLEFVTNWKDLIIGPAMARNCPMVSKHQTDENGAALHAAAVYVVNKKVGRFASAIDLSEATLIYDYRNNPPYDVIHIELGDVTSTVEGVAWVIADQSTGEILLAQNMGIAVGTQIHLPNLYLTHELP